VAVWPALRTSARIKGHTLPHQDDVCMPNLATNTMPRHIAPAAAGTPDPGS